jgi:hypothetical protein
LPAAGLAPPKFVAHEKKAGDFVGFVPIMAGKGNLNWRKARFPALRVSAKPLWRICGFGGWKFDQN